jgi:hypothetical protein
MIDRRRTMARRSYPRAEQQPLATHADVHRAFKHIGEIKALAILTLRPTTYDVEAAARRLDDAKRRTQTHGDAGVVAAIIGILAGEHAQ